MYIGWRAWRPGGGGLDAWYGEVVVPFAVLHLLQAVGSAEDGVLNKLVLQPQLIPVSLEWH
jgi:hypothetical protein